MKTYVLVHGAWHGGWCWKKVKPLLQAAGREVYTPTLTGLGERAHLLSRQVGLDTHVQDVVGVLEWEDLQDVVLVGHSYGGMVIAGVADRVAERLAHLVYLDSAVPSDGQALLDCVGDRFRADMAEAARSRGEGWRVPPWSAERLGLVDNADAAWVIPKLVPQPYKTFQDPVRFRSPTALALPRTYIHCVGQPPSARERPPFTAAMDYYRLAAGHNAMVTAPEELADLLLRLG